ncbi:hypothetical protein NDU88_004362 [Pleurodeles waltl]|uniref:Uncharacterized protein n=1 Tax=Pleurodeles waltl TaxID=8319 RepID=A0AAV7M9Q2_PLEWA|nr:hypothetical protein NDU88_004362 [Pleurodeles waltl]
MHYISQVCTRKHTGLNSNLILQIDGEGAKVRASHTSRLLLDLSTYKGSVLLRRETPSSVHVFGHQAPEPIDSDSSQS